MTKKYDFCMLGGSPAGQFLAAQVAAAGYKTALVGELAGETERPLLKALHRAASAYRDIQNARLYGLQATPTPVHYPLVRDYLLKQIDSAPVPGRIEYTHIQGDAQFVSPGKVQVEGEVIAAQWFALDPPVRPTRPSVSGLEQVPTLTPDNLFALPDLPLHLIVLGGGATAAAFAQAFARLGSRVHLLTRGTFLSRFDSDMREMVRQQLYSEGVTVVQDVTLNSVAPHAHEVFVAYNEGKADHHIRGTHLLLAAGRTPDWSLLNLPAAKLDAAKFPPVSVATANAHIFNLTSAMAQQNPAAMAAHVLAAMGHKVETTPMALWPQRVAIQPPLVQVGHASTGMERYQDKAGHKIWADATGTVKAMASYGPEAEATAALAHIAIAQAWTLAKLAASPGPLGQLAAQYAKPPAKRGLFG